MEKEERLTYAISAVSGFVVCLAVCVISGKKEAWDSPLYFTVGLPVMMAISFFISYRFHLKPWRWVLAMAFGQSLALCLSGNSWNLWPLSIIAMTVCSIPQFVAGQIGARMGRRA